MCKGKRVLTLLSLLLLLNLISLDGTLTLSHSQAGGEKPCVPFWLSRGHIVWWVTVKACFCNIYIFREIHFFPMEKGLHSLEPDVRGKN